MALEEACAAILKENGGWPVWAVKLGCAGAIYYYNDKQQKPSPRPLLQLKREDGFCTTDRDCLAPLICDHRSLTGGYAIGHCK